MNINLQNYQKVNQNDDSLFKIYRSGTDGRIIKLRHVKFLNKLQLA